MHRYLILSLFILFALQGMSQSQSTPKQKVIYVMDPHCGWCFGNGENIQALIKEFKDEIEFEILVGGMWVGENAPQGGDDLHQFIQEHGPGLEEATGIKLGDGYHKLTLNPQYLFSSLEPGAAVVLVKQLLPEASFSFAKDLQQALFIDGKRLDQLDTYLPLLEKYGIDANLFASQWLSEENLASSHAEFNRASSMVNGFPTLLIEKNGIPQVLTAGYLELNETIEQLKAAL